MQARGTFEVKLTPQASGGGADSALGQQQQLRITVVPDSGTEELEGLMGQMVITIADGKHSYDFEYTLPAMRG